MEEKINKKITVCFFSPASHSFFSPNSNVAHGGAELQMYLWAKSLANYPEFEVLFLIENHNQKKISPVENIKLIGTIRLKQQENIITKLFKSIKLFFQLITINQDIIISTNANALTSIIALYSKIFKKKFIYRTSSLIDVNKNYIDKNGVSGKLYKFGLLNASKVITQNAEHRILLKKNHNINAFVLKNSFEIIPKNLPEKKHILWVSRFAEMKNPYLFLDLAKQISEQKFVMICPYTVSVKKNWEDLKKQTENISNLKFIEKVPFNKIQKYFNEAILFVNTSDFEGFPNTFLQAAQAKTPIVSLNVNPDNFLNEYNCGVFCKNNFNLLIQETKNLLKKTDEQIQKGENAYLYLKENHDINKIGKQLKEIISKLLN